MPYAKPEILISTEEVAGRLGDPSLHIVEVDEDTAAYEKGHIRGAVALNWRDELQSKRSRDVVEKEGFEQLLGSRGIDESSEVILYGGNNNWFAAYAYWYLKYYGHERVRLMDGGRKKWELEERELTTDTTNVTPVAYHAKDPDSAIRARRDEVIAQTGRVTMVDVRSPEEYAGVLAAPAHLPQEMAQRKGHIPGAVNVPWSRAANEDGTFKPVEALRELYIETAGVPEGGPALAYCRIGERSAYTWVVLHELLGIRDVKNYDGSWTEYGSLVEVPISTGPEP
ncbi:MAG: sulfurtransferase [Candidatus Dormibacteraeota bacterium]|nr:sulfurtransferase [Candidatus Dormibacteraeota bacterium]MBV9526385.1 sulfurtransferase [Candidatus Dormibacteraeota bacterium]